MPRSLQTLGFQQKLGGVAGAMAIVTSDVADHIRSNQDKDDCKTEFSTSH